MRRAILSMGLVAAIALHSSPLAAQTGGTPTGRPDRLALDSCARAVERSPVPRTAAAFAVLLRRADSVAMLVRREGDYWHVRAALDTRDRSSALAEDSLYQLQDSVLAAVGKKLAALDRGRIERFFAAEPTLSKFRPTVTHARKGAAAAATPAAASLASVATGWQFDLYERLIDRTVFGTVTGPSGPLDVRKAWLETQASPDTATRREAFEKLFRGYAGIRDLLAFTVVETVRAQNAAAETRGFPDRPTEVYAGRGLGTDAVRRSIAAVRAHGVIMQRFERAALAARGMTGVVTARPLTLDQALAAMQKTYGALGPAYAAEAGALLDPTGGRLEIGKGEHRRAGGFSFALPDGHWGVYLDRFGGSPAQVSRLMHESGHALHKQFFYGSGAPYLVDPPSSEAVALFGEILLAERLGASAQTAADSLAWHLQFLGKMLEAFHGAQDAELEQAIYDSTGAGRVSSADDLDRLTRRVDSAYSSDRRPELAGRWMRVSLLQEDPVYLSNYLESGLICLTLYRQYRTDPRQFADHYLAFLRDARGGSDEDAIVRDFGVRLDDPAVQAGSFGLLDSLVSRLERQVATRS